MHCIFIKNRKDVQEIAQGSRLNGSHGEVKLEKEVSVDEASNGIAQNNP